ncbi:DUF2510 domain-containing protein [Streptomyces sp. SP17BM10]|uniref:DUF2510 domain-containing protein n=1 Tax=Streptomyces sp. SP17BM10 TaxID=3002530 RepID=UPI002E77F9FF|nr:DUF2510 domain-containing protein [Streptomyces sp. SP17BM10]MEE1784821.1 DUF2510 domain-containing protein [Streptomyces sp. SP17BM10]
MTTGSAPSGWYDDPSGQPNTLRWWDGSTWTDKIQAKPGGAVGAPADATPGRDAAAAAAPTAVAAPAPGPAAAPPTPTMPALPTQSAAPGPQSGPAPQPVQPQVQQPAPQPNPLPGPGPAASAPQPIPTSVVFETVDPKRGRNRLLLAVGAVVLSLAMAGAGYVVGHKTGGSPKDSPTTAAAAAGDPKSPNGFMGTALTGGQPLAGGRQVTGQDGKMNFMVPQDWQVQNDAKTPTDVRYAVNPYACVGHGNGACTRGLVVQNLRVFNGGWSDPKSLVLGMGQLLYNSRYGSEPPTPPEPVKQSAVKIQGLDGYLALWHVPMSSGSSTPDSYCGVLEVTPAAGATTVPVLQICLDQAAEAPPLTVMDQIANSVKITP